MSEVLYTVFLVHPESGNPVFDAISYWWGQHKMERVGGPKTFYLPRLLQYEFAILLPALALIATRWSRFTFAERFLTGWALSSVAMYAYLGEKAGWLIVHQVLPFLPLAGAAWALLAEKSARWRLAGAAVAAASLLTAVTLSFVYPVLTPNSRKAESTIQVQTCPEMLGLVDEILAYGKVGEVPAAIVSGEAGWPMSWYVRDAPVNWQPPTGDLHPPIVLCDEGDADKQAEILGPAYTRDRVPFRAWWIPDVSLSPLRPNLRQLLLYVFTRETWDRADGNNPIGAVWVTVFRRTSAGDPACPAASARAFPADSAREHVVNRPEISVALPVFNEADNLDELNERLTRVLDRHGPHLGDRLRGRRQRDASFEKMAAFARKDPRLRALRFSRNFGHQMALTAGVDAARGRIVAVMDADLQDPPELLSEMLKKIDEGYEVVYAQRTKREGESAFKLWTAHVFYRLLERWTNVDIPVDVGDFRLMGPRAVAAFRRLRERHRFIRGMTAWVGFRQVGRPVRAAAADARRDEVPAAQDAPLRARRPHVVQPRAAPARDVARLPRLGLRVPLHPRRPRARGS